jgi:type IV pilus assembly protein PilA
MSQKGFTLIELMVTIAIIGILSSLAISSYGATARQEKVRASGESVKEFLRGAQLLSHKEGSILGLKITSTDLKLYKTLATCKTGTATSLLKTETLDNNTIIAKNTLASNLSSEVVNKPTGAGVAGDWGIALSDCLALDPSEEGSVFPDNGSISIIFSGSAGPGAVIYKKAGDRRLHLQFSREGTDWREI